MTAQPTDPNADKYRPLAALGDAGLLVPAATEATDHQTSPTSPPAADEEGNGVNVISTGRIRRDGEPDGVRIVYTARVPRDQALGAFAEAFGIIDRETGNT